MGFFTAVLDILIAVLVIRWLVLLGLRFLRRRPGSAQHGETAQRFKADDRDIVDGEYKEIK